VDKLRLPAVVRLSWSFWADGSVGSLQLEVDGQHLMTNVGHHPDCQFLCFIHTSQQQEPTWDLIIDTRRKCRNWLQLHPPDDFFPEAWTKRCHEYSIFNPG
jgi:hypothetical protein